MVKMGMGGLSEPPRTSEVEELRAQIPTLNGEVKRLQEAAKMATESALRAENALKSQPVES